MTFRIAKSEVQSEEFPEIEGQTSTWPHDPSTTTLVEVLVHAIQLLTEIGR